MKKCSPVEMRANLQVVEHFKKNGINFVVIPAKNTAHKLQLIKQGNQIMKEILKEAENDG